MSTVQKFEKKGSGTSFGEKLSLNARIDAIGWALLFILTGTLWLMPEGLAPEGAWLIGVGLILVGENAARYLIGLKMDAISTPMGVIALATGLSEVLFKVDLFFPVLFLVIGASIFLGLFKKDEVDWFAEMGDWNWCFESEVV